METLSEQILPSDTWCHPTQGENLRQAREFLGYSSEDVAKTLDLQPSALHNLENGKSEPNELVITKFAEHYKWPIEWLTRNARFEKTEQVETNTPLPTTLAAEDRKEFRDFSRVMQYRLQETFSIDTIKKLSRLTDDENKTEALHRELNTYESTIEKCRVEIVNALFGIGVPMFLRPLKKVSGVLLSSGRNTCVMFSVLQSPKDLRFTAASALSALIMSIQSEGSRVFHTIAGENALRYLSEKSYRMVLNLLLPNFLLDEFQAKQKWGSKDLANPVNMYQASLRLGASYQSTVQAYKRLGCISASDASDLRAIDVIDVKKSLLEDYRNDDLDNRDVWCLSAREEETLVEAGPNDLLVVKLKEHSSAGYEWDLEPLKRGGFYILYDDTKTEGLGQVGAPSHRTVIVNPAQSVSGNYEIEESCSWRRVPTPEVKMNIKYRKTPKLEEGLYTLDSHSSTNLV